MGHRSVVPTAIGIHPRVSEAEAEEEEEEELLATTKNMAVKKKNL